MRYAHVGRRVPEAGTRQFLACGRPTTAPFSAARGHDRIEHVTPGRPRGVADTVPFSIAGSNLTSVVLARQRSRTRRHDTAAQLGGHCFSMN
jgi:hypothetical protein